MATSFVITALDIMDATLRKLGVNIQGGTADATQQTEMILALNMMAKRFFTLGMPFYREVSYPITNFTAGFPAYQINTDASPPISGLWNVYQAFLVHTSDLHEIPLRVVSREEYHNYINKYDTALPTQVSLSADGQTAYFYMCPDTNTADNYTAILYGYQQEETYTAGSDTIVFPMEWSEALVYGLCVRMAPEYGLSLEQTSVLKTMAKEALDDAINWNPQMTSTYFGTDTYGH
jgi:hypothetical protein